MTSTTHEAATHDSGHAHPSDGTYVKVAIVLGLITAAEVSLPYVTDVEGPVLGAMLVMMTTKFAIVGLWFMHLRFDSVVFRRLFVAGIALAAGVYLAVMASVQFFGDDTTSQPAGDRPRPASIRTN